MIQKLNESDNSEKFALCLQLFSKGCSLKFPVVTLFWFVLVFSSYVSANVKLVENKLVYRGQITPEKNAELFDLYKSSTIKPSTLIMTSGGGNIDAGMELGEFVFAKKLDIRIPQFCFSSCANYVFTAARKKWLSDEAILGWHGDAASAYWRDEDIDAMVVDINEPLKSKEWKRLRQYYDDVNKRSIAREKRFFELINVDQNILTLGLNPVLAKAASKINARGWTATSSLMSKLGIQNLSHSGQKWVPKMNPKFPLLLLDE